MGPQRTQSIGLVLSDESSDPRTLAASPKSAQALASRCRIVLACAEGGNNIEVGARLGVGRHTWASGGIASWRIDLMA